MKLNTWIATTTALNEALALFEGLLWGGLVTIALMQWPVLEAAWVWIVVTLTLAYGYRLRRVYRRETLWQRLEDQRVEDQVSGRIALDLSQGRGHFPNDEALALAKEQLESRPFPAWPMGTYASDLLRGLAFPILAILLGGLLGWAPNPGAAVGTSVTRLHPPVYLQREGRIVDPRERELAVYPGTLLSHRTPRVSEGIQDEQGRRYLPLRTAEGYLFEARLMEDTVLEIGGDRRLKVKVLEDPSPTIQWVSTPASLDLKAHSLSFRAEDEQGLHETLISINEEEVEYAGDPQGRRRFRYRWDFDPREHLPLMGGNVELEIIAYDNDRVNGPKSSATEPLIWEFPGIDALAEQTLEAISELKEAIQERRTPPHEQSPASLMEKMAGLEEMLANNPSLPPNLASMARAMSRGMKPHEQQTGPPSQEEAKELDRDDDLLDYMASQVQRVLDTIEAARLVEAVQELADQAAVGQASPEQFEELFTRLEKHIKDSDMHPALAEHLMSAFNRSELMASMGDHQGASEALEQLAEGLRSQPQSPSGGPNPIAERFQQTLQRLSELITDQGSNRQKALGDLLGNQRRREAITGFRRRLRETQEWMDFQELARQLRDATPAQAAQMAKNLDESRQMGAVLQQLDHQLARGTNVAWPEDLPEALLPLAKALQEEMGTDQPADALTEQLSIATKGNAFASDFRSDFQALLGEPRLFHLSDRGALYATKASKATNLSQALAPMQRAQDDWTELLQNLQAIQQQAAAQGAMGQGQQLTIGPDGQLQLSPGGRPMEGADGKVQRHMDPMDIALPEEFRNGRKVEQLLKEALQSAPSPELKEPFRRYMLDLLQ